MLRRKLDFSALVRACDDHQALAVGVDGVAHHTAPHAERKASIVQSADAVAARAHWLRLGKAHRRSHGPELFVQVQAADVEGELRPQHLEEAQDVIDRLSERIRDQVDSAVSQLREGPRASLVAFVEAKGVTRRPFAKEPLEPVRSFVAPSRST